MVDLNKKDWEKSKQIAEAEVKQAMIMKSINERILALCEEEVNKFPSEE